MNREKLRPDVNETAYGIVQAATGQGPKPKRPGEGKPNPTAAAMGRRGGLKGGPARKASISKEKRRTIAKKAAKARWKRA